MTAPAPLPAFLATRPGFDQVEREALRILRRLTEPGAFVIVSRGLDAGAVFVDRGPTGLHKVAEVAPAILAAFWSRGWVVSVKRTPRLARYGITAEGRAALRRLCGARESARRVRIADRARLSRAVEALA